MHYTLGIHAAARMFRWFNESQPRSTRSAENGETAASIAG